MKYHAIATDYDGTLATDGWVTAETLRALGHYRNHGGQLILVTGRELDELLQVFAHTHLFDSIMAENGAVLHHPQTAVTTLLAEPFPPILVETLTEGGVNPISRGRVVVATWQPHGETVEQTINTCGFRAAVANALPALKEAADWISPWGKGHRVQELIEKLLNNS